MSAPGRLYNDKGRLIHRLPEGWPDAVTAGEGLVVTNPGWFEPGPYRVDIDAKQQTVTLTPETGNPS